MGTRQYSDMERRKHTRAEYPAAARPVFRFRGKCLEIKDISRGGMRFCCEKNLSVSGWINGSMELADGTCVELEGIIVRVDNQDMGLSFIGDLTEDVYRRVQPRTLPPKL